MQSCELQVQGAPEVALKHCLQLLDSIVDLLLVVRPERELPGGVICLASASARQLLGYAPEELVGQSGFALIHPDDLAAAERAYTTLLARPDARARVQARVRHRDGDYRLLEGMARNCLHDPALRGLIVTVREIGEARRSEDQIRLQGAALEAAANSILITDRQGSITWANRAFLESSGYCREELVGQSPSILRSGKHPPAFYGKMWQTILGGSVWTGEVINRRRDGSEYTEETTITPVRDERGEISHFIAIKRDVTAERQLQAELHQAQKMESVGRLAGGVAHDFNNLLTVISGYAELAASGLHAEDPLNHQLEEILRASERASSLTRQLLVFSRRQVIQPRPLSLGEVVSSMEKMLRRLLGEDVELVTELAPDLPLVLADPGQMEQVTMNLAVNARDAMPDGGTLTIRTGVSGEVPPFVRLEVEDTGIGISSEVMAHMFEPFYTTKAPDQGTGLGLSTVYGIVQQASGRLEVASQVGAGATFRLLFPAAPVDADAAPAAASVDRGDLHGSETVLLVEDDDAVRRLMSALLRSFGYGVLEEASAEKALLVAAGHPAPIQLLVTDVILPRMNGRELYEQLALKRPEIRVLYASGYTAEKIDAKGVIAPGVAFLQKPFAGTRFVRKVREILDQGPLRPAASEPS